MESERKHPIGIKVNLETPMDVKGHIVRKLKGVQDKRIKGIQTYPLFSVKNFI